MGQPRQPWGALGGDAVRHAYALPIGLVAAAMLGGCATSTRLTAPRIVSPASAPAPAVQATPAAAAPASAAAPTDAPPQEPSAVITRLAVVQSADAVPVAFRDGAGADLRAPARSTVGDRAREGAKVGATPGAALAYAGYANPGVGIVGIMLALAGGAVGAVAGTIVGSVQDAVYESNIPREKIVLHAPALEAAANDLVRGPRPLHDCVTAELGTAPALTPTDGAGGAEAPDFAALAQRGYSHVLMLDGFELAFVQDASGASWSDGKERFAARFVVRYSMHELGAAGDSPRVVSTGQALQDAPALRLDRWAAERGREVRELAARDCPLLAAKIGADLSARYTLAPR